MRRPFEGLRSVRSEFLTPKQLQEVLGLSRSSTYRLLDSGLLTVTVISGKRRVHRSAVIDYLNQNTEGNIEFYDPELGS